jgi:Zn-dependent protease with chaperone function
MTLPFFPRLACVVFASFLALYLTGALATALCAPRAIRRAARWTPDRAARFLLTLRLLPAAMAAFAAAAICAPGFLFFEPDRAEEPVGLVCLALAAAGLALCGAAILRTLTALVRSALFARRGGGPAVALVGVFRTRVLVSEEIAGALSDEEMTAVLRHESAHRASHDNLKRLLVLLAPGTGLGALERAWMRFAEHAADRAATAGDARRSLALASALVRVARFGSIAPAPPLAISLLADPADLAARVEALLSPAAPSEAPRLRLGFAIASACTLALLAHPATFRLAHDLQERLLSLVVLTPLR